MSDPGDDDRLNDTDEMILELLREGRETTKSLADQLDKHPQTVRDRLRWLREWGFVKYHHEPTGLHELESDGEKQEINRLKLLAQDHGYSTPQEMIDDSQYDNIEEMVYAGLDPAEE